ncbi:MAG TPA: phosphoribosylglycinamide synthetase C domain-containing protein [Bacteroidia bacterium]|nr:phosphoribosylglycinamide synthetase C domain-containing protein [Bacteroidia bacterium]HNU32448.1 phosphoribosylglycinamide synthetase C domain-containing protein [Bacteroidia bacterium]
MEKKKFLFVSYDALISDIAWQVVKEGHDAKYYIREEDSADCADGFVPKIKDWQKEIDWADIIVFDDVLGMGAWSEDLKNKGKVVVGGSRYTDKLEDDRTFGQEELKKYGVNIIPFQEFTSFDDAIRFVQSNPSRYVIKPSGEAQNYKRLLFVGEEEDGKDVVQMLEAYKKTVADKVKIFQLQKRVTGVEVAVGAFFNGNKFMTPINVNFEHKKLFPGNIGPATGEMGTTMYWSEPNKLFAATLQKMETKLREEKYTGYMDVNCIVNSQGIYPLEFTARFGYPTISIQQEGINIPFSEFLYGMADGTLNEFKTKKGFQLGVRICMPPFPFNDDQTYNTHTKDSVIMFKKKNFEGIHIEDVKLVNGEWMVAGSSGVIMIVVGTGSTMKQAKAQAYSRVANVMIPGMYYRDDIGERWIEDSDRLHSWGYLRGV